MSVLACLASVFGRRLQSVLGHLGSVLAAAWVWFDSRLNVFFRPIQHAPFRGLRLALGEHGFLGLVHGGVGDEQATTVMVKG